MLAIAETLYLEREEIASLNNLCLRIMSKLKLLMLARPQSANLSIEIGFYARTMPEYEILISDRKKLLSIIRKICTGEFSLEEGYSSLALFSVQLSAVEKWIQLPECLSFGKDAST